MSIRVTLNCCVKSGQLELLLPFLEKHLPVVRAFNGCLDVTIYFDKPNSKMLIEEQWLSVKHHRAYIEHIENNGVLAELALFLASAPSIKYFEKAAV